MISIKEYFVKYINSMEKSNNFEFTGMTKADYLDVMEKCLDAYDYSSFETMSASGDIQSYSRVVCVMGALLSEGRLTDRDEDYYSLWIDMMDNACSTIRTLSRKQANDFSIKELMLAYKAMKDKVKEEDKGKPAQWYENLSAFDPYTQYQYQINGSKTVNNINVYNMAGEYLRYSEGMISEEELNQYYSEHWPWHIPSHFDENSMYLDPHNPMLYDLTTRVQMQLISGLGYSGEYSKTIDSILKDAGLFTMFMQSSAGQMPYGGRSNQYLFNEVLIASNCEYEAARHKALGNDKIAGAYKRSAHLAVKSIDRWLNVGKHIKNMYPNTTFGTETYGYFDKYMVTAGSFLYIGYLFADDTIEEFPAPCETGGYVFETSDEFHKVFANCQGYSIEIDTDANYDYDSTGLGRIHKEGAPIELALSIPMTATPSYRLTGSVGTVTKTNASLCPGWQNEAGGIQYLSSIESSLDSDLKIITQTEDRVEFEVTYTGSALSGCKGVTERYLIDSTGVLVTVSLIDPIADKIYYQTPVFLTNGKEESSVTVDSYSIGVSLNGYTYTISSSGKVTGDEPVRTANRNGEYSLYSFEGSGDSISMKFNIEQQ